MSMRGKRGVSKGSREFDGAVYEIKFRNKLPCGKNRQRFMDDFNQTCEKHLCYWEPWKNLKGEPYDHVWSSIRAQWNIPNNDAKLEMPKYSVVDMRHWDEFVASRETEELKLKSSKAQTSARHNKNPSRLGRTGLSDVEDTWTVEWDQLVLQHPWLAVIQNVRSKIYALAHLPKDKALGTRHLTKSMEGKLRKLAEKEQNMLEDGTYHLLGRDPITEVFGKEHGGRTKGVSTTVGVRKSLGWVKGNRERHEVVDIEAIKEKVTESVTDAFQDMFKSQEDKLQRQEVQMASLQTIVAQIQGSSYASDGSYDGFDELEDPVPCDLLWPYSGPDHRVATGKVYPTRDATLHGSCISEGYIKVQVDMVIDGYKAIPVPKQTEKVSLLEHSILEFIEWPRKNIKIHQTISPRHSISRSPTSPSIPCQTPSSDISSSSYYRPQMLESQVALHPQSGYTPTSWPQLVASEHAEPKKTQKERVQERLNALKHQSKALRDSAKRFTKCENLNISIVPPNEMYDKDKPWEEWIEYEAILDLHINAKIDITFVHWWSQCLYLMTKVLPNNKCAFLNPHVITSSECRTNDKNVIDHIMDTRRLNPGKEIYMAPYMQADAHWVLIVLCPNSRKGYILDSYKYETKNENSYYLPGIVERALETKFDWMMVKCFQQKGKWECGYYMLKFMYDIATKKQVDFPKSLWNDSRRLTLLEIEQVALLMLNAFYRDVVVPLNTTAPQ